MNVASKIRILTSLLALASSLAVGLVMYWGYRDSIADLQGEVLEQRVEADVSRLNAAFLEISRDIRLLEGLPAVRAFSNGSSRSFSEKEEDLTQVFRQLLIAKPHYVQVRLIGLAEGGREVVRVDRSEAGIVKREGAALQQKGERNYFLETMGNAPGEIYYSDINLNREHGEVDPVHQPMLRVALPVYDPMDTFWGIVIVNMDFRGFVDEFFGGGNQRFEHFLCNEEGDYLVHPDASRTYGFDLGTRYRVQDEYPEIGDFLTSDEQGVTLRFEDGENKEGSLFHLSKVFPLQNGRMMLYGVSARFDDVISASKTIVFRTALITVVLLGVALVGAFLVSLLITKPLEKVTRAVRRLAQGQNDADLPLERDDEIGTLANSFKLMSRAIMDQEERILAANRKLKTTNVDLEHFVHISSHELREPLTRIAGLASLLEREIVKPAGDRSDKTSCELAGNVKREAGVALRQITDFRVFSKIGDGSSERELVDLNVLARGVLEEFTVKIESRRVRVSIDSLPRFEIYENLVRVLYRNLVENALKYAVGDGVRLHLTCEEGEKGSVLGVYNSGSTIAEKDRESVFQLFLRLSGHGDGSGVGLSICKRVVERHMGEIWVESGEGFTHFKFTLRG